MAAAHILRIREVEAQRETAARLVTLDVKADATAVQLAALDESNAALHVKLDAILARLDGPPADQPPTKKGPK